MELRVKLYVPTEESFSILLKCIAVTRTTYTSLDVSLAKQIEDYWNVYGERELSDAWTSFSRFIVLNERPPDGYTWSGEINKKTDDLKTGQCMARYVETYV